MYMYMSYLHKVGEHSIEQNQLHHGDLEQPRSLNQLKLRPQLEQKGEKIYWIQGQQKKKRQHLKQVLSLLNNN